MPAGESLRLPLEKTPLRRLLHQLQRAAIGGLRGLGEAEPPLQVGAGQVSERIGVEPALVRGRV